MNWLTAIPRHPSYLTCSISRRDGCPGKKSRFPGTCSGRQGKNRRAGRSQRHTQQQRGETMEATRTRSAVFLIHYAVLLLAALVWVQFEFVRRRMGGSPNWFHLLIGAAFCCLGLRAYLVLGKRISRT